MADDLLFSLNQIKSKTVYSLLRSIAGSPSSSSSSPNFHNCSSPRESASMFAAYLRFHFFVSQPKALRSRARDYLFELRHATCFEESHSSICSSFNPAEFLAAASNLSSSITTDWIWHGSSSSRFQSLRDFALLSFHLEDIFYYSHPQHGKASRLLLPSGLFLSPPAYQSFLKYYSILSTLLSGV